MAAMETSYLILAIVIAIVVLIAIVLAIGYSRRKKNTISFEEKTEPEALTQLEKSGNYQAQSGFNFAPAHRDEPEKEVLPGQRLDRQPQQEQPLPPEQALPQEQPLEQQLPVEQEPPADVEPEAVEIEDTADKPETPESVVIEGTEDASPQPIAGATEAEVAEAAAEAEGVPEAPAAAFEETADPTEPEAKVPAPEQQPEAEAQPAPQEVQLDEIEPAEGRLQRLRGRLSRSQSAIGQSVLGILGAGDLDEDAWEEIEDTLIMADLGAETTMTVVEKLRHRIASEGVESEAHARAMLREVLIEECQPSMERSIRALPHEGKPAVILVVGVNGTGKTTTTGKLARVLVAQGHDVVLGAADTFRAAAADQLEAWGRRVGAATVRGKEGADPASVAFDAVSHGIEVGSDVVMIDTAGRLHTKTGLMDQLDKIKRVVEKKSQVDEVILVLDATVGQNGLAQARTFRDVVDITGVALTKLDGTAKGGIVFQVQHELGVPVKLVGLGEGADHLAPFEVEGFVDALLGGKK